MDKKKTTGDIDRIVKRAQTLCAKQEKCSADMRLKLIQWGLSKSDAEAILAKLVKDSFIDDKRYANIFVREKCHFNKWGTIKIAQALRIKGIPEKIINDALDQVEQKTEEQSLINLLSRKIKTIKAKTSYELKGKLIRFALSRGYKYEEVLRVAANLTKDDNSL